MRQLFHDGLALEAATVVFLQAPKVAEAVASVIVWTSRARALVPVLTATYSSNHRRLHKPPGADSPHPTRLMHPRRRGIPPSKQQATILLMSVVAANDRPRLWLQGRSRLNRLWVLIWWWSVDKIISVPLYVYRCLVWLPCVVFASLEVQRWSLGHCTRERIKTRISDNITAKRALEGTQLDVKLKERKIVNNLVRYAEERPVSNQIGRDRLKIRRMWNESRIRF